MSLDRFNDDCPGCQPVLLDAKTRRPMPEDSPEVQAVLKVWATTTRAEREAFHRICCLNSREPGDLKLGQEITSKIKRAVTK
jgi:hypothetical protein